MGAGAEGDGAVGIDGDTVVVRAERPLAAPVDDELVMLDPVSGSYFGLDVAGRAIWEQLGRPRSVDDLCGELVEVFDVAPEVCAEEVRAFLAQLHDAGLLRVVEG